MNGKSEINEIRPKRERNRITYLIDGNVDECKYTKLLATKGIMVAKYPRFKNGHSFTIEYVNTTGLSHPIVIETSEGLGMEMPHATLTVVEVANLCGRQRIVDVLEVSTQTERQMTLLQWADYFSLPNMERCRILNVITLEIGGTELGRMVKRPDIVNRIDWIDNIWPKNLKPSEYPQVQLYCLMSVQDSYTE